MPLKTTGDPVDDRVEHSDHMIYAVGNMEDGSKILAVGFTAAGVEAMADGKSLHFKIPPVEGRFVAAVVFAEDTLEAVRRRFAESGMPVSGMPS